MCGLLNVNCAAYENERQNLAYYLLTMDFIGKVQVYYLVPLNCEVTWAGQQPSWPGPWT